MEVEISHKILSCAILLANLSKLPSKMQIRIQTNWRTAAAVCLFKTLQRQSQLGAVAMAVAVAVAQAKH